MNGWKRRSLLPIFIIVVHPRYSPIMIRLLRSSSSCSIHRALFSRAYSSSSDPSPEAIRNAEKMLNLMASSPQMQSMMVRVRMRSPHVCDCVHTVCQEYQLQISPSEGHMGNWTPRGGTQGDDTTKGDPSALSSLTIITGGASHVECRGPLPHMLRGALNRVAFGCRDVPSNTHPHVSCMHINLRPRNGG